ncbi:alkylation response protein AidB-like acyl-CoA dehydrogenase [Streptomyces sp. SAI-133]|uniref:hydrolase n=1 Tax=unclassified Streptomyces TaxID=2593676 RepID=UPI00247540B1|nr:hydrolase [Streptomyces sp. SAI-133]MDH6584258.1 alkylation response protein AidB-like acyl-CoA dehydrogenase [Streptomyces sp. SAI-133]
MPTAGSSTAVAATLPATGATTGDAAVVSAGLPTAAAALAPFAGRRAEAAERARDVEPAVLAEIVRAGFARHFVPAAVGGTAGSFTDLVEAVEVIAGECPASSWCASLIASIARMAGAFLPEQGQAEVWADGPDAVLVGSVTPFGTAVPAPGGWLVRGRWPYISGVSHSDWALMCGLVETGTGSDARLFALPRSAYRVEDTWHSVGMAATGSNTLVLDEVFVPEHLSFDRADLFAGRTSEAWGGPAAACHRAPLQAVNGLMFAAPAVGAALGMVHTFTAYFAEKAANAPQLPGTTGVQGVRGSAEQALARSAGEVDAARLLLGRAARLADEGAVTGPLEATRNLRDCALAVDLSVTAVDRLFRQAGTRGQALSGPMQRLWRDVTAISTHVALQFEPAARGWVDQVLKV